MGLNLSPCLKNHKGIRKTHEVYGVHLVKAINDLDDFEAEKSKMDPGSCWRGIENLHPPCTQGMPGTAQPMLWVPA